MVPTAFILGSDEYHTQAGNAISLVCIIENVSFLSSYVFFVRARLAHYARTYYGNGVFGIVYLLAG